MTPARLPEIIGLLLLILCIFACGCVSSDTGGGAARQSLETDSGGMANPTETADAAGNGNQVAVTPAQGVNTAGNPQSSGAGATGTNAESDGSGAYEGNTKITDADTKIYPVLVPDAAYQGQSVRRTFNTKFENKIFSIFFLLSTMYAT